MCPLQIPYGVFQGTCRFAYNNLHRRTPSCCRVAELLPWEKGLVKNTNKLIQQYILGGTDFSTLSDDYILHVQTELCYGLRPCGANLRPRKLLNFSSPKQKNSSYLCTTVLHFDVESTKQVFSSPTQ